MKQLKNIKTGLLAAGVALAIAFPVLVFANNDETVKLADCPAAVQKTIKKHAEGGEVVEVEKETKKDGTVVYEAEIKKDGKTFDVVVAEDGKLIKVKNDDEDDDDDGDDDDDDKK